MWFSIPTRTTRLSCCGPFDGKAACFWGCNPYYHCARSVCLLRHRAYFQSIIRGDKMKKFIVLLLILFAAVCHAEMDGKVYQLEVGDYTYTLTFQKGPFGPGESGTVTLYDGKDFEAVFNYHCYEGKCILEDMPFATQGTRLVLFKKAFEFEEVKE